MKLNKLELKELLDEKYHQYNSLSFIDSDPISIPHLFSRKQDVEIAAFLIATIAWGQRKSIINNGKKLMHLMGDSPYEFVMEHRASDLKRLEQFVHRTFNGTDCVYFIKALKSIYTQHKSMQSLFVYTNNDSSSCDAAKQAIINFRTVFFKGAHPLRTLKHVSNPAENSAAKRLNMFLRWMVRKDNKGVDFGIWNVPEEINTEHQFLRMSDLCCPLDVHSGTIARKLGILKRTQNDWKAVEELTLQLRLLDAKDPVKYDFSLFGLGVFDGL